MDQTNQAQKVQVSEALKMDPSNDPNCLLGRRFLCRGSGGVIVGESGTGKSSFALQFASRLAVGKPFFGIRHPKSRPLRVLLVQAENDELEVAEVLQSIVEAEGWDEETVKKLDQNLHIYCSWDGGGGAFAQWLGGRAVEHKVDIAFVDPLMSFCGCDAVDNAEMGSFLRRDINSQLKARNQADHTLMNFGLIVIHHTGKKASRRGKKARNPEVAEDANSYDMMGASELTNWARFIMHLKPSHVSNTEQKVFEISISKRGNRSGMKVTSGMGEKCLVQYSSKKGIKPGLGATAKSNPGTGLNLIHWEEYTPVEDFGAAKGGSAKKAQSSASKKKLSAAKPAKKAKNSSGRQRNGSASTEKNGDMAESVSATSGVAAS